MQTCNVLVFFDTQNLASLSGFNMIYWQLGSDFLGHPVCTKTRKRVYSIPIESEALIDHHHYWSWSIVRNWQSLQPKHPVLFSRVFIPVTYRCTVNVMSC